MQSLTDQKTRRNSIRSRLDGRTALLNQEKLRYARLEAVVNQNTADAFDFSKAIDLCKVCIKEQSTARKYIEDIITALLQTLMEQLYRNSPESTIPVYSFILEPVEDVNGVLKGLKPKVLKNGQADDVRRYGGGIRNSVSIGHRLVQLLLNPKLSPVLMLDESLTNVASWRPIITFFEHLQRDIPIQIICITHSDAEFPHVVEIWKEGDVSKIREHVA